MVKRGHYPCFRSSVFTADLAFRNELFQATQSIIITKVRNDGYTVIWQLLNMFERHGSFSVLGFLLVEEQLIHREQRKSIP